MSKKSRRRNKKILAILGGLGAATMLGRRKRNAAIDKGIASAEADKGSDMLYSEGVPDRVKSIIASKKTPVTGDQGTTIYRGSGKMTSPHTGQTIGAGGVNAQGLSRGQLAQAMAANAAKNKAMNYQRSQTFDARPKKTPNFYPEILPYKHGGSVQLAKRGLGRAFTKSKK